MKFADELRKSEVLIILERHLHVNAFRMTHAEKDRLKDAIQRIKESTQRSGGI